MTVLQNKSGSYFQSFSDLTCSSPLFGRRVVQAILGLVALVTVLHSTGAHADPYPPTTANGAAHFAPVAWPNEPADITTCGISCGDWKPYTRFQSGVTDPRTQDPSNGGTAPQNYVNISSSCIDKSYPSVYYNLYKHPTDSTLDVLFFRWRVEQIANNYATGPSAGNYSSSDPWSSALWTVLFDIDGSGYRTLAAHLNGSSGAPATPIDMLAGIWGNIPTQSIDYLNDPNIKLIAHNPTAFTTPGGGIYNYQNTNTPVATWPAGSTAAGTTYDYGTSRSRVVSSSPCNEYFVDYQIPIRMLDASATGLNPALNGPKITRSTPISMLFCTANSLNNPFQKDCALNRGWAADAAKPAPFGDYISFDQTAPYAQPIVSSVTATPPNTCPGSYALQAKVQDTLYVDSSGNVKPSVKQVQFFYWLDKDGDGTTAGDTGSAWTLAATGTLKAGTMNTWTASWDASGLPKGKYLIGVQAVDDKTLHDDGVPDSPVDNRTFSYMVGSTNTTTQGQIYINPWTFDGTTKTWTSGGAGAWVDTQQASFQSHTVTMTPGSTENWFGNPAVTGVQTALIGLAVNACGVAPTITKTVSPASVATTQSVTYTVTVANATGGTVKLTQLDDPLPSGFTYASTSSVTNNGVAVTPTTYPANGASGTVSWIFNGGAGIDVANNTSAVLTFVATASSTAGTYNNTATASTSLGAVTSAPVAVGVDAARVSLSKTPSTYSVNPGGSLTYTLAYSNDSSVPVTSATLTDTLPTNVSCTSYTINGGSSVACSGTSVSIPLGTLAAGATGSVALTVAVASGYNTSSLVNTASIDVLAPDGVTHVTRNATSTIAVNVPSAAFSVSKTASASQIAENANVTWTIAYSNYGNSAASNVSISDPLPSGFTYVSSNPVAGTAPAVGANGTVIWSIGSVAAGASGSVQVVAKSSTPFSGTANPATNTATLSWTGGTSVQASNDVGVTQSGQVCRKYYLDNTTTSVGTLTGNKVGTATALSGNQYVALTTVPTGGTSTVSQAVTGAAELEVGRFYQDPASSQLITFDGSSSLTGQIYYTKSGADPNAGLTMYAKVYDYNPSTGAETLIGSTSYADAGSPTPPISLSSVVPTGTLAKGHRLLIVISAKVTNASKNPTVNLNIHDSRSYVDVCAPAPANLVLQKTASASTINVTGTGRTLTYTLNYSNTSSATAATNVVLTDTLPTGTTFASASATPAATSISTPAVGANGTVTWNFASVAASGSGSATVVVNVPDNLAGTTKIDNSASISSTETTTVTATASTGVTGGGAAGTPALVLAKSANKTLLVAGDTVTYTLTVVNTGAGSASSVVVTDDFPDQTWVTYGSCTTASGTCSQSPAGTLSWNVGTLAGGASATLTFTMTVAASGIPVGANTLNNSATVSDSSYCTSQAVAGCASNTVTVTVSGNPSLSMTKTSLPASVKPGDVVTYTMVVTNGGSGAATGVVVSDPVPANTVFKAITTAGPGSASFDAVGNRAVFNIGTLASGASATVAFSATVNSMASGSTTITNTASTTATNSPQRSASANSTATAAPVMTLQKNGPTSVAFPATTLSSAASATTSLFVTSSALLSVGDSIQVVNGSSNPIVSITAIAGNVLTVNTAVTAASGSAIRRGAVWALTYQNTGNADASGVVVSDPLPANWVYVSSSPTASSAPTVGTNGTVSWTIGSVAAGASGTLQVLAIPTASGSVTNTATLSATGLSNVSSSLSTAAGGLAVTKSTSTPTVAAGGVASYTITVSNSLGSAVSGFTVTDLLPSGFTYKTGSATLVYTGGGTNGAVEPTLLGGDSAQPQWSGLNIGANGSIAISFQANVAASVGPATYQNSAELSSVPAGVGVTPFDPLSTTAEDVTVLASNTGVVQGYVYKDLNGNGTYDAGTDVPLTGVRVTITDSGNTSYTVSTDSSGFFSRVVAAGTASVNVVDADIPVSLVLATGNSDPANVSVPNGGSVRKDTGYSLPAPAWQITKSHTGSFVSGSTGTYTLVVKNIGSAATTAGSTVTVTDTAPSGMTVTAMSGTNWTCTTLPSCTRSDALAAGASYESITVTVSVSTASASLTNAASVTGGGVASSANTTDPTTILQPPAFSLTKTAPASVVAGNAMTYTMTLTNIGASTSGTSATIKDTLPAGVTVTGATAGSGVSTVSCPSFTSPFTCTVTLSTGLAVNGAATFTLSATAPASAGSITNNASVDPAGGTSPQNPLGPCTPTSACSSATTTVSTAPTATWQITKSHSGNFVAGSTGTYTLTVKNVGGAATTGGSTVTVTDTTPTGMTVTAMSGTSWTCTTLPNCTRSDALAAGATYEAITVTVSVASNAGGTSLTNAASVSGGGVASTANTTDPTTITAPAAAPDMAVSLAGLPGTAQVGIAYSGSFTCTNSGAADATASTTCSVTGLPAGVTAGSCTIDTASPAVAWVAGNTVPVGKVVTCSVSGTPTAAGSITVNGSTGATSDSNAANNTASKSIVVNPTIGPLAVNDSAVTNYNTSVTISASSNDSAGTGATLTLNSIDLDPTTPGQQTSRTIAGEGTFVANSSGTVTFTPLSGFVGVVTVPYTIQNSLGSTSNVANITVTVRDSANSGIPAAQNDYGSTTPNTPVTLSALSNDQPSASKTLVNNSIVLSGANAAQGTWVANADGTVTFTPAAGFKGTATVNYTVRDTGGGTSNTATITVTVSGGSQPSAQNDSASTKPSTAVTMAVLSNDTPGTGNILTTGSIVLSGTTASNGTWVANADGTVTFTPANGFSGTATANYTVQDSGGGTSNTATITVTVNPVAPAATNDTAPAGIRTLTPATNDTASAGATLNPSTVDLDPNTAGIQRSFTVAGQGTWDVIDNNGTVRFTPVAGFYGMARLTYAVSDSLGNTATAVMSVPIDPSGVVYDSSTRTAIAGATVTLLYNGGSASAYVTTGNATMATNASGQYAFFLIGGAPAGTYSLTVSKAGYRFQSLVIPPAAGSWPAGGGSIGVVGAPTGAQSTLYYLSGPLPTTDVTNNNIPLDPLPGAVSVPTLSQWGLIILTALMVLAGMTQLCRRVD